MGRIGSRRSGRTGTLWFCPCFAVFVLYTFAFRHTGGQPAPRETDVDTFLDEMERQVRAIAYAAAANYEKATELVTTCGDPGNCSREICSPLEGELESLSCVGLVNNSNCSPGNGSQVCNTGLVTYKRSFVRVPRAQLKGIPPEVATAVCVQRNLEPVFKGLHQNTSKSAFLNSKMASIDGTQRFYPGRELKDCSGTYDPRRRPWYAGAISVKKRLVILLDSGQSMNTLRWLTPSTSAFAIAQTTASALLRTLTPKDEASVTLFAPGPNAKQLDATVSVPETGLDATFSLLQSVDNELEVQIVSPSQGVSNVTAGLTRALSFLNMEDEDALKVIVVLTDGFFGDELNRTELEPVIEEIRTNSVKVLMFVLGGQSNSTSFKNLASLACDLLRGDMSVEVFAEIGNPLFGLRNLFSFFARAHLQAGQVPFWQPQYTNYDNLGEAVDVSYPAMTAKQQLIGVASIGIQVNGLSPTIQGTLGSALVKRAHTYTLNPSGVEIPCQPEEDTFADSRYDSSSITGICPSTGHPPSFTDLSCCQQCGGLKMNKSTFSSATRAAVIAGAAMIGVAALLWLLWFWSRRRKQLPPPPKLPILPPPVHAEEPKYL